MSELWMKHPLIFHHPMIYQESTLKSRCNGIFRYPETIFTWDWSCWNSLMSGTKLLPLHYSNKRTCSCSRQVQYLGESHAVLTSVPGTVATRVQTVFSFKRPSLVVTQLPVWEHVFLLVCLWTHGLVVRSGGILCFVQFQGVHHVLERQFPFDGVPLLVRVADSSWLGFYAASPGISPLVVFWRVGWLVTCTFSYMKQNI